MFETQLEAWTRVQSSAFLRQHTPAFHGAAVPIGLDETRFLADCCYVLEYVDGTDGKVMSWEPEHLNRAAKEFVRVGIQHYVDASAFRVNEPDRFVLIDFACRDVVAEDECCFEEA